MKNEEEEKEKDFTKTSELLKASNEKDKLILELKRKIQQFESEKLELLDDREKLAKLYELGLIDSAGEPLYVDPPDDHDNNKEEFMKF